MKFQVDQDRFNILKFNIVPEDQAVLASQYFAGIYQRMKSGSAAAESAAAARKEVTTTVATAFKRTDAYDWLRANAGGKAGFGGEFSAPAGSIPIPRISVTFTEAKVACKFKLIFGRTLLTAD
jgi:hypothetical protein